jgi:hypothetical protein
MNKRIKKKKVKKYIQSNMRCPIMAYSWLSILYNGSYETFVCDDKKRMYIARRRLRHINAKRRRLFNTKRIKLNGSMISWKHFIEKPTIRQRYRIMCENIYQRNMMFETLKPLHVKPINENEKKVRVYYK